MIVVNYNDPAVTKMIKRATKQCDDELNATPRHLLDKGNPNHPDYDDKLFGYTVETFLAKQYKE